MERVNQLHQTGINQPRSVGIPQALVKWSLAVVIAIALAAAVLVGYVWFSGGTGQASTPVTAPSLKASDTGRIFHIAADESEVRFVTHEILLGQPKTVVGTTNQVAGDIMLDLVHPANTQLGLIRLNARTLKTDNEIRNRALRSQILMSNQDEFEFINFVPTKITGLPEQITVGQSLSLQIEGKLTVRNVTRDVTFAATVEVVSQDRLQGSANTTLKYRDFNITIPEAPGVANVSKDVRLEFDFVARPH
jgi:polyisoprenoid-binding protein YceI